MAKRPEFHEWRPHPWHGLATGRELPLHVNAYIEITPFDLIKYEVDKASGYLRVDRPQRTSSQPPSLYGFVPRTYCGDKVAALCPGAQRGDGDPLDICVLSERPIARSEIIVPARIVGGLQLLDRGEADDKIIAVLEGDLIWGAGDGDRRACRRSSSSGCSTTSPPTSWCRGKSRRSRCSRCTARSTPRAWSKPRSSTTRRCSPRPRASASGGLQLRHRHRQPLHALAAEVDLHAGVVALAFGVDDHARAELGVHHVLADAKAVRRAAGAGRRAAEARVAAWARA